MLSNEARGDAAPRKPARRLARYVVFTLVYVFIAEYLLFGQGLFWRVEPLVPGMEARWRESMRIGAYVTAIRGRPPGEPRLIAIGSSVVAAGFDAKAFQAAWLAEPERGPLDVFAAPLSGCWLVEGMMLSQVLSHPPPTYIMLGVVARDVMPVMPESLLLSTQAFHVPRVLPSRSQIGNATPETFAQGLWRRWWPGYQHRILMQQLAVHYRPALRQDERAEVERGLGDLVALAQDGADIPLLGPWADWCRSEGIQPILVLMPVMAPQPSADGNPLELQSYRDRCRTVALASGIWFIDAAEAMPNSLFADHIHLSPEGARRFAPILADQVASRARGDYTDS